MGVMLSVIEMTDTNYEWAEIGARAQRTTWAGEEPGDTIYGVVVEIKTVTRKDETQGDVMTIDNPDTGDTYTVWIKSQLKRLVVDGKVQPGDLVKIVYEGKQKLKSDKTKSFRAYKLYIAAAPQ